MQAIQHLEQEASYQFTKNQIAELEGLRSENARLRSSYDAACMLVAQMHEAVMGEVVGPHHGVVEDVRNKVAEQAVVIEKLRYAMNYQCKVLNANGYSTDKAWELLATQTNSKQVLAEWLDAQLGEPVAWMLEEDDREYNTIDAFSCGRTGGIPLFKKPELK